MDAAVVKPTILQNRFYRQSNYDVKLRAYCSMNAIAYESFWTLTANPDLLASVYISLI